MALMIICPNQSSVVKGTGLSALYSGPPPVRFFEGEIRCRENTPASVKGKSRLFFKMIEYWKYIN